MKLNQWTLALAAAGVVSVGGIVMAEEAQHQVLTALSATTLSGYVDTSAIWKFGTGNAAMPGRSFDGSGKQDGFNLNVVKLSLEKKMDESQWAAGYRLDVLAGADAAGFPAYGAYPATGGIGAALEQAYVNLRAPVGNGLDFKMGVFDGVIGYESFDAYKNPNYSRSYGYALDPKQHTGLLASYQVAEWMNFAAGIANTYSSSINARPYRLNSFGFPQAAAESEKTYLALVQLTAPESMGFLKGATLYGGIVHGLTGPFIGASQSDITSFYVGTTVPTPVEGLAVGASYDYKGNTQNNGINSFYANATALYLSYQATEKLKLNNRVEYASGSPGTWQNVAPIRVDREEEFFGETFTVDYSLWANVTTRAEFRWDRDLKGGAGTFGNLNSYGTGFRDKNAFSLALNVIYKF